MFHVLFDKLDGEVLFKEGIDIRVAGDDPDVTVVAFIAAAAVGYFKEMDVRHFICLFTLAV
ncbi:MAG: hypothetical protein U5K69_13415 [Balneolaceae bacterium]|nr:hypothetical protein [Balneolaceae bacterium]